MYNIDYYKDEHGRSEILDYIDELKRSNNKNNRIKSNKINSYINMLSISGLSIGEPYIKHISNDIWELRPLKSRILFCCWYNNSFLLLNIFTKSTQKTPKREIEKAKRLFEDYKKRSEIK